MGDSSICTKPLSCPYCYTTFSQTMSESLHLLGYSGVATCPSCKKDIVVKKQTYITYNGVKPLIGNCEMCGKLHCVIKINNHNENLCVECFQLFKQGG